MTESLGSWVAAAFTLYVAIPTGELALAITAPGCDQYGEKYSSNPDWPGLTYVIAPW